MNTRALNELIAQVLWNEVIQTCESHYRVPLAGSQFNRRSKAATWSNFLELVTIVLAKFWIDWSLLIFLADVFDHKVEQYKILLKTNDAISNFKVFLIKAPLNTIYLIQLRKAGRDYGPE